MSARKRSGRTTQPDTDGPIAAAIRRADHRDLERILALWLALIEHHADLDPLFALRSGAETTLRRLLETQLRDAETAVFVRDEGGRLAGFCSVHIERAPPVHREVARAEIMDVLVRAERRRCGIGRALVAAALAWVRGRDVSRVEVRVAAQNAEAQHFWRALDFGPFVDVLHRRL
ncbi:MAG TPA: GNAT family N-acetyltransferase [Myxococcota bacterium]